MIYGVYSVSDRLVGFNSPFIMVNDEVAKREFVNSVTKNPSKKDLTLYKIGSFDDENGTLTQKSLDIMILGKDIADEV